MKPDYFKGILVFVGFFLTCFCQPDACTEKLTINQCPLGYLKCLDECKCIPLRWIRDRGYDCADRSDEDGAFFTKTDSVLKGPAIINRAVSARNLLLKWFVNRRKVNSTADKWGHQLHRTATALFLADQNFFLPENTTVSEMAYELTIQMMSKLSSSKQISSEELALYINALLVTCINPRKFYGQNLVQRLREQVDAKSYANPIEMIALCNAKDSMTIKDVEKVTNVYDSSYRAFWIDSQALAIMALSCMSSMPHLNIDRRTIRDMTSELKKHQHLNGTVENLKTTALVLQSLIASTGYARDFEFESAVESIIQKQNRDGSYGSFLDSYNVLIALSLRSLVNITMYHCPTTSLSADEESLHKFQNENGERIQVTYSVMIGEEIDLSRTWKLKVSTKSTFYDVIETAKRLDSRYSVQYNVFNGKPYPAAMFNVQDDPELGFYWFVYKRGPASNAELQLVEASPVDVKVQKNEEIILWYKYGEWNKDENVPDMLNSTSIL